MNADKVLLDAMVKHFEKYGGIERAVLFGSRARGDCSERSDYDIAVYGKLAREEISGLSCAFEEELPTLHKVDLVFVQNVANEKLLSEIEKDGVEIYVQSRK